MSYDYWLLGNHDIFWSGAGRALPALRVTGPGTGLASVRFYSDTAFIQQSSRMHFMGHGPYLWVGGVRHPLTFWPSIGKTERRPETAHCGPWYKLTITLALPPHPHVIVMCFVTLDKTVLTRNNTVSGAIGCFTFNQVSAIYCLKPVTLFSYLKNSHSWCYLVTHVWLLKLLLQMIRGR